MVGYRAWIRHENENILKYVILIMSKGTARNPETTGSNPV